MQMCHGSSRQTHYKARMNVVFMIPKPATTDPWGHGRKHTLRRRTITYSQYLVLWGFRTRSVGSVARSSRVYACLAFSQCCKKKPNEVAISLFSFSHDGFTAHWIQLHQLLFGSLSRLHGPAMDGICSLLVGDPHYHSYLDTDTSNLCHIVTANQSTQTCTHVIFMPLLPISSFSHNVIQTPCTA